MSELYAVINTETRVIYYKTINSMRSTTLDKFANLYGYKMWGLVPDNQIEQKFNETGLLKIVNVEVKEVVVSKEKLEYDNLISSAKEYYGLKLFSEPEETEYLIGQRVVCCKEIGKIVKPEHNNSKGIWVFLESKGYASCYDKHNVKPLPNGEL